MRFVKLLGCLVLLAALVAGGVAWWGWDLLHRPFGGGAETVVVEPGTAAGTVLTELEARGVIANAAVARTWLIYGLGDPPIHAGEYRFEGPTTTVRVLDTLIRGDVVLHQVTVVEGLTLEETADSLVKSGFGDRDAFLAAMRDPAPIADLDPEAETLEGYLFPETYSFQRGTSEREIVHTLVQTFRRHYEADVRPLLASPAPAGDTDPPQAPAASPEEPADGATPPPPPDEPVKAVPAGSFPRAPRSLRDLVTLASIVEKEARVDAERPLIAAVYANRLAAGMGLYADPTVIYALKRRGEWNGNLTRENLQVDSPYNTYRYGGLPPGPIASPGLGSLRAAARPAEVPYLYFVSRNDGTHAFATTLREHNANVQRWQREYWRRRWAEERRAQREKREPAPPSD